MTALAPCTTCLDVFDDPESQREHYWSDRHTYNVKRKQSELKPVSAELWAQKMKEFAMQTTEVQKGTAHLKKKDVKSTPAVSSTLPATEGKLQLVDRTACHCLFDEHKSASLEENMAYMRKKYSFSIPDPEYVVLPEELLQYLAAKIYEGHTCVYCDRAFNDSTSCLRHMFDKNHTRVGTEAYTRTGQYSQIGTDEMQAQLEPFYDYSTSVNELNTTKKVQALIDEAPISSVEKLQAIFDYFDEDEDGLLRIREAGNLYEFSQGMELSAQKYEDILRFINRTDGINGINVEALGMLYEKFGTLDADFEKLDDLIDDDEEDEEEDDEFDIKECDDEEEFKATMEKYGLQPCSITDTGDLRLPDGSVATHRQYHYIYKQRGRRLTDEERRIKHKAIANPMLMLSNTQRTGVCQIAISSRQRTAEGKQIIAILRRGQKSRMNLGRKQNLMQTRFTPKIRTIRGDGAGGR